MKRKTEKCLQKRPKLWQATGNVLIRKRLAIKTLRLASVEKAEIRRRHDDVVDDSTRSDQVDQPIQHHG